MKHILSYSKPLSKAMKLFLIIINSFFISFAYAQELTDSFSKERVLENVFSLEECEDIFETFYKTSNIDAQSVIKSLKKIESFLSYSINLEKTKREVTTESHYLHLYLFHANILAFAYQLGALNDYPKLIKEMDERVSFFMKAIKQTANTYLKYADYIFLKLANGYSFPIQALPIIYRKVLLLDKENKEALVKLAIWYISPANEATSNFNGFIEKQEKYIEDLKDTDRFNACLWYSIYYMKCYNEKKAFQYLNEANKIFPNHFYTAYLFNNFKNGILKM